MFERFTPAGPRPCRHGPGRGPPPWTSPPIGTQQPAAGRPGGRDRPDRHGVARLRPRRGARPRRDRQTHGRAAARRPPAGRGLRGRGRAAGHRHRPGRGPARESRRISGPARCACPGRCRPSGAACSAASPRASSATGRSAGNIPFSPRAKKVLELSLREALRLKAQLHRARAHRARHPAREGGPGRQDPGVRRGGPRPAARRPDPLAQPAAA